MFLFSDDTSTLRRRQLEFETDPQNAHRFLFPEREDVADVDARPQSKAKTQKSKASKKRPSTDSSGQSKKKKESEPVCTKFY